MTRPPRGGKPMEVHICGVPDGPYRYGGFLFEVHPYIGPNELLPNGDPINKAPSRRFLKMWDTFSRLPQDVKDQYAATIP